MTLIHKMMMVGLGMTVAVATITLGDDGSDRPIPEQRQARLLERYGDQGIDANGDGELTRKEVQTFRAENGFQGQRRGFRAGRGEGRGHHERMFG